MWELALQADESEFILETESVESWRLIEPPLPPPPVLALSVCGLEVRPASTLCFLSNSIVCLSSRSSESFFSAVAVRC